MALTLAQTAPRFGRVFLLIGILVVIRAISLSFRADEAFILTDSDNLMRLVQVRDWLGGQGWFDLQQYRVLPPEGIEMHWSRYVDAGIAAVLVPLTWFYDLPKAEFLMLVIWPSLMLIAFFAATGFATYRLFGTFAAFVAGLATLFWPKLGTGKFSPGNIDHHSVQYLFSALALMFTILPIRDNGRRVVLLGVGAGVSAAAALVVGLEMLPFLLLIWGMAALRFAMDVPGSRAWLAGYSVALGLAAPLLLAGQTPVSKWLTPYCDVLATPLLAVLAAGIAASLAGVLAANRLRGALPRFALMAVVAGVGLWLAAPLAGPCLSGPYGAMPAEAEAIITERVTEAQPALSLAEGRFIGVFAQLVPVISLVIITVVAGWSSRAKLDPAQRQALIFLLVPAAIGIALSFVQMRALSVAVPAVPVLAGYVALIVATQFEKGRHRVGAMLALCAGLLILAPKTLLSLYQNAAALVGVETAMAATSTPGGAWKPLPIECRDWEVLQELKGLPPDSVIFSELNFGPMIIAFAPYSTTAAGYHRSADAYWNGVLPYERQTAMIHGLHKSGADYLMVCRISEASGSYAKELLAGNLPPWLIPTSGPQSKILLLKVDKPLLAAAFQTNVDIPPAEGTE